MADHYYNRDDSSLTACGIVVPDWDCLMVRTAPVTCKRCMATNLFLLGQQEDQEAHDRAMRKIKTMRVKPDGQA